MHLKPVCFRVVSFDWFLYSKMVFYRSGFFDRINSLALNQRDVNAYQNQYQ